MIRLFVPNDLAAGAGVALSHEQSHYLVNVMRQKAGDVVALFNGRDGEWRAVLAEASKRRCLMAVETQTRAFATGPDLELIATVVKRSRLETIVEKAAELGARRVRLAVTRHANTDRANVDRLQAIAIEASEQTGRLDVPEIVAPEKLERLIGEWPEGRRLMFCDEGGDARPVLDALGGPEADAAFSVLIGPEGGFSPEERTALRGLAFVTPVSLGPRILRADTAAISALTLWQAARGDWRTP
jgi:16S rRNA (uracil1498-N3)-methyltransferase